MAKELGLHPGQFSRLSEKQFNSLSGVDYSKQESEEVRRLKRELHEARKENEFLKKAAAEAMIQRLKHQILPGAKVAFMLMTDKQYGMTREFPEPRPYQHRPDTPDQIMLI